MLDIIVPYNACLAKCCRDALRPQLEVSLVLVELVLDELGCNLTYCRLRQSYGQTLTEETKSDCSRCRLTKPLQPRQGNAAQPQVSKRTWDNHKFAKKNYDNQWDRDNWYQSIFFTTF